MTTVAAETHELIPELCRQFGEVTGWRLHFTPLDRSPVEFRAELENRSDCCWFAEISDGSRLVGFLHMESPSAESPSAGSTTDSFFEAKRLAATLAKLLGWLAQATTQLTHPTPTDCGFGLVLTPG